jgi:dolichyl-diphosphooligosaccharide--protein glycosyltransferase
MKTIQKHITSSWSYLNNRRIYLLEMLEVISIFLLAFLVRIMPYKAVFGGKTVNFFAQDPYYHARRIQLALFNNGIIPTYDSYCGFPDGIHCFWSNFYDYSILWSGMILSGGKPSIWLLETLTSWAPVIWGILSLIPAYLLIRLIFNKQTAFLSLILISIFPGHIYQTLLGRADHYGADPLFPLFMFYFLIQGISLSDKPFRRELYIFLSGLSLTLSWLVWPGSTIFAGICLGYIVLMSWLALSDTSQYDSSNILKVGILLMGTSFISIFPFCAASYWGKINLFEYDALSWFQLFFLAASMGLFLLLFTLHRIFKLWKINQFKAIIFDILVIFLIGVLTSFFLPDIFSGFKSGLGWVAKTDPWLKTITEFQPIFINIGVISWYRPFAFFSYGILLVPILFFLLLFSWLRNKQINAGKLWFVFYSACMIFLGINQTRFSHFFALIVSTLLAWGLIKGWEMREAILFPWKKIDSCKELIFIGVWLLGIYVILKPALTEMRSIPDKYAVVPGVWKTSLEWMRDNTPPTEYYLKPYSYPEYTVLAPWSSGHWINYIARRPSLANGFHVNNTNNKASMSLYLSDNLTETKEILRKKKVRYLFLTDLLPNLQEYAQVLEKDNSSYVFKVINHPPQGGTQIGFVPTEKYDHLISTLLYLKDGNNTADGTPGCFRLVYETQDTWQVQEYSPSVIRIYEFVKGYEIKSMGAPGETISVSVKIKTNTKRLFTYQNTLAIPASGHYHIYLPYSQEPSNISAYAVEPYHITIGKQVYLLRLTENQIAKYF